MAGVRNSSTWSQTDGIAEVLSAKSCQVILVRSPPDYVEKISRYLESSTGQSKQDTSLNEPPEAESDSGDSLFITQKAVPEAVRSKRRLHYSLRSTPTTPRDLEESGSDTSSSSSDGESRSKRTSTRKKYTLPKYSFPFLSERKWKPTSTGLPVKQNTCLHNSAMGGFFNCVKETWQGSQGGDDLESWLPTADTDGEYISPLSEDEERPEEEDIKVVLSVILREKKCFAAPVKAKNQHTWWDQLKEQTNGTAGNAGHETPPGRRCKMLHKTPVNAPKSRASAMPLDSESAVNGESSCRARDERERNDEHMRTDADPFSSPDASKSERHCPQKNKKVLHQQKDTEDELCDDSDATVCELNMPQRSPQLRGRGGSTTGTTTTATTTTEPQTDDFPTNLSHTGQTEDEFESQSLLQSLPDLFSDSNNDRVCSEIRIKRRKRNKGNHESKEKEKGQSQEEPEGLHAAKSVNVGAKETARLSEDNREEPVASQTNEGLKFNNNSCMESVSPDGIIVNQEVTDIPDKKQKKKKRKNVAAGNIRQEVDGNIDFNVTKEDLVFSGSCSEENGSKDEKKKKERKGMDDNVKQLESNKTLKPLSDSPEKKKKRKKEEKIVVAEEFEQEKELNYTKDLLPVSTEQLGASRNGFENTAEYEETLEASYVNGTKCKKKRQSFSNDGEEDVGMSSNNNVTLEESTELIKKKKKKKKRNMCEEVDISDNHEQSKKVEDGDGNQKTEEDLENQTAEEATKKKKNKVSENSRNISKETVAQGNDSVSARKKEKKRTSSFLVADVKEKDAQTHEERNCPSQSEAHVCDAEKLPVSTANFEAESAEISENLEESLTGIRKKKRKRKMSVEQECEERDHKLNFEATNDTCQSATSETTETGVKRKKKQKRNESELTTPMEELESAPDEPVVLKRKKKKTKSKDEPCHVTQKSPAALATEDSESETCTSASPKKKGKHMTLPLVAQSKHAHDTDMSRDSSTSDQATESTLNMVEQASSCSETPGHLTLNGMRQKEKKKKVKAPDSYVLEGTECAEVEPRENKKREKKKRNKESSFLSTTSSSPVLNEISLSKPENSESVKKNKHKKVKRTLHNANDDFLTDLQYEP